MRVCTTSHDDNDFSPVLRHAQPAPAARKQFERWNQMLLILLVIVLLLSLGSVPAWPYSRNWGYYPSGGLGIIVIILLILILMRF